MSSDMKSAKRALPEKEKVPSPPAKKIKLDTEEQLPAILSKEEEEESSEEEDKEESSEEEDEEEEEEEEDYYSKKLLEKRLYGEPINNPNIAFDPKFCTLLVQKGGIAPEESLYWDSRLCRSKPAAESIEEAIEEDMDSPGENTHIFYYLLTGYMIDDNEEIVDTCPEVFEEYVGKLGVCVLKPNTILPPCKTVEIDFTTF